MYSIYQEEHPEKTGSYKPPSLPTKKEKYCLIFKTINIKLPSSS